MALFAAMAKWGRNPHYNRGIVHFNRGEFARAAECFDLAAREVRDPNDPDFSLVRFHAAEARANLGLAFFHAGDYPRAEAEFTKALAENPTYPDLRYCLARIYERSARFDEAVAQLRAGLGERPRYA